MIDVSTIKASHAAIAVSTFVLRHPGLAGAMGPDFPLANAKVPGEFDALTLDEMLSVLAKLGLLGSTPKSLDYPVAENQKIHRGSAMPPDIDTERLAALVKAVHRIFLGWPQTADRLFANLANRNRSPSVIHPVRAMFATNMGYRLLGRLRSLDGRVIMVIDDAFEAWLLRTCGIYMDGRKRAKVVEADDIAIDVADAMRRLEGKLSNPLAIRNWIEAGAVRMIGKKVSLESVTATVDQLAGLPDHELDDALPLERQSCGQAFNPYYRRSDAICDILSGVIRVQHLTTSDQFGLAGFRVSGTDLLRQSTLRIPPKIRELAKEVDSLSSLPKNLRRLHRRANRLRKSDAFAQPSKLRELVARLWPNHPPAEFESMPSVRCAYMIGHYGGRDCPRRLYSVADALDAMTELHGSS
ncbi:MAG: hypothetical protein V4696_13825 [Pseudomonadota bacterium]